MNSVDQYKSKTKYFVFIKLKKVFKLKYYCYVCKVRLPNKVWVAKLSKQFSSRNELLEGGKKRF